MPSPWLQIQPTRLDGLAVVERRRHEDTRGFFTRIFCAAEIAAAGLDPALAQINHSYTRRRGSVRGLHYQRPPHGDGKIVSCLRGEIFDVAVDLRRGSPTFLQWHAEILSSSNPKSLFIPRGFAHGFQTLTDDCELIYLHSAPYVPAAEGGFSPTDPALRIDWPLPFADVSERDATHPQIHADFTGLAQS